MQPYHFRVLMVSFLVVAFPSACQRGSYVAKPALQPVTTQPVGKTLPDDSTAVATIAPYRQQVNEQMNAVIGTAPVALLKNPGESPLANFVADLQRSRASRELGQPIDLSVMSNGGLRAPLPAGPVTLGAVFELMPFENELVVLDAPAAVVQQLFDYGAPVKMAFSGATYAVGPDGKAIDIRIGNQPFNPTQDRRYTIAISDYLAGGGDQMTFFKVLKPRGTGVLLRNAIADQIRELTKQGQPVEAKVEGRVKIN